MSQEQCVSDRADRLTGDVIRQPYAGVAQIASLTSTNPVGGGIPEPATWTMMILGFGGLGALLRRRRKHAAVIPA